MEHRGFYARKLPHFDAGGLTQFISFSLVGSHIMLAPDRLEPSSRPTVTRPANAPQWLALDACAAIVQSCLEYGHPKRYDLHAWAIMPDHVHVLLTQQPGFALSYVINGLKSYSALQCNRHLGRTGRFWACEYWDRMIRNENHFREIEEYIRWNPVRAGLVQVPEAYRWSHAWKGGASRVEFSNEDEGVGMRELIADGVQRRGPG